MTTTTPDISLIIPFINEAAELPGLFASLTAQKGINLEVILCDGGSNDDSPQLCREWETRVAFPVHTRNTPRGRGLQMNAGADAAQSDLLLFLHADSRFSRADALLVAVSAYRERSETSATPVAARFRLHFLRQKAQPSLAYYFYESKARLNRPDCIRGDQGFLLPRELFIGLGRFDTSLPFLEDVRLVAKTAERVQWLLLPAEISTSARRFETEGLYERQVVNAIITNAVAADWTEFFSALSGLYQCSIISGRLQLFPLLDGIRTLLAAQPASWRGLFWRITGRHVAGNIWQIFFWLDVRSNFISRHQTSEICTARLEWFQRNLEQCTRGWFAEKITAAAVWIWFRIMIIRHRRFIKTS